MNNINENKSSQFIVFEVDSLTKNGTQQVPSPYLDSMNFKTQNEFMKAKDDVMNYLDNNDISFSVKLGNDLEELRRGDLITFNQFKNIFIDKEKGGEIDR